MIKTEKNDSLLIESIKKMMNYDENRVRALQDILFYGIAIIGEYEYAK